MSTQIFLNNNACKPEFTKIAAHSLVFAPTLNNAIIPDKDGLFYGDSVSLGYLGEYTAVWSGVIYNYSNSILAPSINSTYKTLGIPLPINLVAEDKVTISGTAVFNNYDTWAHYGYELYLSLGVFYFDCADNTRFETPAYTFIPVQAFTFDGVNTICFETSITLGSNFDIHNTRFLIGFNVFADCPSGECDIPGLDNDSVSISYTFDIERPCAATIDNFIIKNCCEPIITELVHIPGLQVGNFHVDDEGNCWEVMSASSDVTNFTRNFVDIYTSCLECQDVNGCPDNLKIESCCVQGQEYVSSSLPGLDVGDTFVDNNGLCWGVSDTTGAPITEESITVDTIIPGGCEDCTLANPCPNFWYIESCCAKISEIIATSVLLDLGDSFVDTNGICWSVVEQVYELPTNYNIVVDTVYSVTPVPFQDNCEQCIFYNPCPLEYFLTVRACCDPDRIEVIAVPAAYMSFSEGTIFKDQYQICWEVMSYSTTGVETYPINWSLIVVGIYKDCSSCINGGLDNAIAKEFTPINTGGKERIGRFRCVTLWQVRDCNTDEVYTAILNEGLATVGSFHFGQIYTGGDLIQTSCFEVLGYGYPAVDPLSVAISPIPEYVSCEECFLQDRGLKILEIQPCCSVATIIVNYNGPWTAGIGGVAALNRYDNEGNFIDKACYTLIGLSSGPVTGTGSYDLDFDYSDCPNCLAIYPCA